MDLDAVIFELKKRLGNALPGAKAHEALRAIPVGTLLPRFEHKMPPKPGSVLILLYPENNTIVFPLIKRADYQGAHSGQISFPGGKAEQGEDPFETALREAQEEIGIHPSNVEVIGKLSNFFVIPSNFLVTPVIGVCKSRPVLIPDAHEVVKILHGDLGSLISDEAIKSREILVAGRYRMQAPHFKIENEVVWGATAMMLNEFRWIIKEVVSGRKK